MTGKWLVSLGVRDLSWNVLDLGPSPCLPACQLWSEASYFPSSDFSVSSLAVSQDDSETCM